MESFKSSPTMEKEKPISSECLTNNSDSKVNVTPNVEVSETLINSEADSETHTQEDNAVSKDEASLTVTAVEDVDETEDIDEDEADEESEMLVDQVLGIQREPVSQPLVENVPESKTDPVATPARAAGKRGRPRLNKKQAVDINKALLSITKAVKNQETSSVDEGEANELLVDQVLAMGPKSPKKRGRKLKRPVDSPTAEAPAEYEELQRVESNEKKAEKIIKELVVSNIFDLAEVEPTTESQTKTVEKELVSVDVVDAAPVRPDKNDNSEAKGKPKRRKFLKKTDFKPTDISVFDFAQDMKPELEAERAADDSFAAEELDSLNLENFVTPTTKAKLSRKSAVKSLGAKSENTAMMCNYCNYTSTKRYLLQRHMRSHSEERPHRCNLCGNTFKTVSALTNHVNTHTGVKPHQCKHCEMAFTTSGELIRHVRYKHTKERPHKCSYCDYASVELSKLRRHVRAHTGERPYQCPLCDYASQDTYKLKRHLRIHTGEKPYECDLCHAKFSQSNTLKAHRRIHTGDKPKFECPYCPTTCGRSIDLRYHIENLHTSSKPVPCRKCGREFPDRYTLKVHNKTHEGERCFKCSECDYSAYTSKQLLAHEYTHTGEKPFVCNQCNQPFRQKQLLKRHVNLYHTPDYKPPKPRDKVFECPECSKLFANHGNLLRHLSIHDTGDQSQKVTVLAVDAETSSQETTAPVLAEKLKEAGAKPNESTSPKQSLVHKRGRKAKALAETAIKHASQEEAEDSVTAISASEAKNSLKQSIADLDNLKTESVPVTLPGKPNEESVKNGIPRPAKRGRPLKRGAVKRKATPSKEAKAPPPSKKQAVQKNLEDCFGFED